MTQLGYATSCSLSTNADVCLASPREYLQLRNSSRRKHHTYHQPLSTKVLVSDLTAAVSGIYLIHLSGP